jgi:threonine synthase
LPSYVCPRDQTTCAPEQLRWRCPVCGSPWDLDFTAGPVDRDALPNRPGSLWRYAEALPLSGPAVSLGEGRTPLVELDARVSAKIEYVMPTLSFKDRGAAMLIELARRLQPERVIADSSGNAGTAIAAYAARAGLPCRVIVPAGTSPAKLGQIRAYGADVEPVEGDRSAAARAARAVAGVPGTFYASHVFNPYFLHGTKTYGYELWEDLGQRLPQTIVVPVGNGTLLLGVALAIEELARTGLIRARPRIVGVQTAAVAPLAAARRAGADDAAPPRVADRPGRDDVAPTAEGAAAPTAEGAVAPTAEGAVAPTGASADPNDDDPDTVAEGIAIAEPARARQILAAIQRLEGDLVTVDDDQTRSAQADLARRGLYVEPTAAVCWAAVRVARSGKPAHAQDPARPGWQLLSDAETVIPLCGAGLKSSPA